MGDIKKKPAEPSPDGATETDTEGEVSEDRSEMPSMKNIRRDS